MVITDYRVQSVLRTYARQLKRSKILAKGSGNDDGAESGSEKVTVSGEGKRRLMMDRLTSQILEKVYPKQDAGPATDESGIGEEPITEGSK